MEMPTVGNEQQRLNELFYGTWRGEETLYPSDWDPRGGTAFGTWVVQPSLDGFCLLVDYSEERDGKVVYRGHGIHTWDPEGGTFLSYWFDNLGGPPQHALHAKLEGNRYWYQSEGPQGWQRMTYEWRDRWFEFRIDASSDGRTSWYPVHEGRYTRAT
jgi:hypothetical protein